MQKTANRTKIASAIENLKFENVSVQKTVVC